MNYPQYYPKDLKNYQRESILHMLYNPVAMLWLQMGLGKTIITLTTIIDLMKANKVKKTLIFAPLRVVNSVWEQECKKWTHTYYLKTVILGGSVDKRERSFFRNYDIYLVNYELMNWVSEMLDKYYISQNKPIPFQCVAYDEVSKLKNANSLRMAGGKRDRKVTNSIYRKVQLTGWKKIIPFFKYRYGLTGTPASNGYIDLHGQYLAVDNGERLGKYITNFREAYFTKNFNGWGYSLSNISKKLIENKIKDITLIMDSKDYLDLPKVKVSTLYIDLPKKIRKMYEDLEEKMFVKLEEEEEKIEVFNAASLTNKCLQFCNGFPYIDLDTKEYKKIHEEKLKALEDVLEESSGSPVLCSYTFKSDAKGIMNYFKKYNPVNLTETPVKKMKNIIDKWNNNEIKLLIGHPASMGHGIDGLQRNGSIMVWFGLNWSLELYEQMNSRLNRQGQKKPVSIIQILCKNTVDMVVKEAIERKIKDQVSLKNALKDYKRRKQSND